MQWRGREQSGNVVDRRGMKTAGALGGGGIILAIIYALLGGDPRVILDRSGGEVASTTATSGVTAGRDDEGKEFVAVVLRDTEDVWRDLFAQSGKSYVEPKLVLFNGRVQSACGTASSAVGPFYCPGDQQVFLDLDFFATLSSRLGAQGDFARAYVIAHEVGHHVQNLLGYSDQVQAQQGQISTSAYNQLSVRLELQADCFAGVWAKHAEQSKKILEQGDLEEALNAAAAVGDDRLQQQARGQVMPDSFTHGTSQQRASWFSRGFSSGAMDQCDTFSAGV